MSDTTQAAVDRIVRAMVEMGNPVEMTHKNGFRPDYIPTDWIKGRDREEEIAHCLIEGWSSKSALRDLIHYLLLPAMTAPADAVVTYNNQFDPVGEAKAKALNEAIARRTQEPPADNELAERLRMYCDGIIGNNELSVGLLMCREVMQQAATALSAQAARVQTLETLLKHSETTTSWHVEQNAKQAARLAAAEEREDLLAQEITNLRHDLERHIQIASDLATENGQLEARIATMRVALELARRALVTGLASYEQPLLLGRFGTEATSAIAAIRTTEAARVGETPT